MSTDWSAFPGPKYYQPTEVEPALAALAAVSSKEAAESAYRDVLSAVGSNNHGGALYPAAVAAAPRILAHAFAAESWARYAAFEVLVELCVFGAEADFERFIDEQGREVDVKAEIMTVLRGARSQFLSVVQDASDREDVRIDALNILERLEDECGDIAAALAELPERSAQGSFDGTRRRLLIEHGYL